MMTVTAKEIQDIIAFANCIPQVIEGGSDRDKAFLRRALGTVISAGAFDERRASRALKRAGFEVEEK